MKLVHALPTQSTAAWGERTAATNEADWARHEREQAKSAQQLEDEAIQRLEAERAWAALTRLPNEERTVCERYYFDDLSMREIAEEHDASLSWVSRVHTRALKRLRALLLGRAGGSGR